MSLVRPLSAALGSYSHDPASDDALEKVLLERLTLARERYMGLAIDDAAVLAHIGSRLNREKSALDALCDVDFADLLLARAAASGDSRAIALFEEHAMRGTEAALSRRGISEDVIEEAKQNVREHMLAAADRPRVLDYNGRSSLKQWLRVAVVREGIHLAKRASKGDPISFEFVTLPAPGDDPELAYFKARYRDEYKQALEFATAELSSRERALLRQHYLLGMNVDEIGIVYQVHRATAARWVQSAREELFAKARFELTRRLGVSRDEIENIVRMIESQLDVSLNRLLATRSHVGG